MRQSVLRILIVSVLIGLIIVVFSQIIRHINSKNEALAQIHISRFQSIVDINIATRSNKLNTSQNFFNVIKTPFTLVELASTPQYNRQIKITDLQKALDNGGVQAINKLTGGLFERKEYLSIQLNEHVWINYARDVPWVEAKLDIYSMIYSLLLMVLCVFTYIILFYWKLNDKFSYPLDQLIKEIKQINFNNPIMLKSFGPAIVEKTIFALNELQAAISNNKKEREIIFASISHDLKTPLTRIKMKVELLDKLSDEDERFINNNINEMDELISNLLRFIKYHHQPLQFKKIDLTALLESMINDMIDINLPVKLSKNIEGNLIVDGDHQMLRRAFDNLLSNAIKYGKVAKVSYMNDKAFAIIYVDDMGEVIKEEKINMLFSTFYREDKHANYSGYGLGLSIVHSIIVRHGGSIQVSALSEGGNRFQVKLPLTPSDDLS